MAETDKERRLTGTSVRSTLSAGWYCEYIHKVTLG